MNDTGRHMGLFTGRMNGRAGGRFGGRMGSVVEKRVVAPDPGGWVPTDIAGCQLWLKADAGITKDGSNYVSQWADQSGNNNHAVQATGSAQPLWVDGQLNGNPVVKMDDVDDFLEYSEISDIRTIFIIANSTYVLISRYDQILGDDNSYDFCGYNDIKLLNPSYANAFVINGSAWLNSANISPLDLSKSTNYQLFEMQTTGNCRARYIGNDRNIGAYYKWNGSYAEILLYNTVISTTDRQLVENYLNTKYALW